MTTQIEIIPAEVPTKLRQAVETAALEPATSQQLSAGFAPFFQALTSALETASKINVTDPSQVTEIKAARAARLELRRIRCDAEITRKKLKENSLRMGKAIDGVYNILALDLVPAEERLEEMEKIAERIEAERKAKLKSERIAALTPYGVDTQFLQLDTMPQEAFEALLAGSKAAHEAKIESTRKAEEDAREKARKEAEEAAAREAARQSELAAAREAARKAAEEAAEARRIQTQKDAEAAAERVRIEAERKAEREAAEKARKELEEIARKERESAERKAAEERKAREAAESEAKRIRDEQESRLREQAEAARKAALAPDKEKLISLGQSIASTTLPDVSSDEAKSVLSEFAGMLQRANEWLQKKAERL